VLERFRYADAARKVVGIGSVGTRTWMLMLLGRDDDDPLFLQVKQAQASVLAPYVAGKLPFENQGQRVVVGQHLAQGAPDIFLGWGQINGNDFYVRQLADMKGGATLDSETLDTFDEYCALCGWALGLAHAKSGDAALIAGYCGNSAELTMPSPSLPSLMPGRLTRTTTRWAMPDAVAASVSPRERRQIAGQRHLRPQGAGRGSGRPSARARRQTRPSSRCRSPGRVTVAIRS
jgi:hypothetical protein